MPVELEESVVKGLMRTDARGWDTEVVRDICNERDAELIQRIPIPMVDKQDSWYWMFEETGIFTVRSCYRRLKGESSDAYEKIWKTIWSLKLPGKIINFVWRACQDCIPTKVMLVSRRVDVELQCPWCRADREDLVHVIFNCVFARGVWEESNMGRLVQADQQESFREVFQRIVSNGTREQVAMISMLSWNLWNRRNCWVWDKINKSVFGVKASAVSMLSEWRRAQNVTRTVPGGQMTVRRWGKPEQGWVKINVDAATFADSNEVGVGAVIRDEHGSFLRARCRKVSLNMAPNEAEALSLKEALSWVKELGYDNCVFETDAKNLADACKGRGGRSFFHTIVEDCVEICKHYDNVLISFIHRSANEVAHMLARATHSMSEVVEWVDVPPEFISESILSESF